MYNCRDINLQKIPNGLSRCPTKRKIGACGWGLPSFGMTPTCQRSQILKNTLVFQNVLKFGRRFPLRKMREPTPLHERFKLTNKDNTYYLEDNTLLRPQGDMTVILKYDIEGGYQ